MRMEAVLLLEFLVLYEKESPQKSWGSIYSHKKWAKNEKAGHHYNALKNGFKMRDIFENKKSFIFRSLKSHFKCLKYLTF